MSHTYASVEDFKAYLADDSTADHLAWTEANATILTLLEGASRRVDGWAMRSDFGSGFGPRVGTNRYDHDASTRLEFRDDVLGLTSVTMLDGTGGGTATLVVDTDYYLTPYSGPPYTGLVFTSLGEAPSSGLRVWALAGTFGYAAETSSVGTASIASASTTSVTLSGGSAFAGHTLLVGSEQLYVTASTGGTALTVARGQNGTTAAAGTAAAVIYKYPREVVTATLQIASRRHRAAQAGVQGDFGGGSLPIVGVRDTETSILRATIPHLRRYAAV